MPYVNDASADVMNLRIDRRRHVNPASGIQAEINCSLCTCAAVVMHATGTFTTSGQVAIQLPYTGTLAAEFAGGNPHYQHSMSFSGGTYETRHELDISHFGKANRTQMTGILNYCRANIPNLQIAYEIDGSLPLPNAKGEMRALGTEFLFAVLVEDKGHWNFAHNKRAGLEFVDYQSSHPAYGGTSRGANPRLGIRGEEFFDGKLRVLVFHVPGYTAQDYG